ncbi:MerR family transcriptional regulator [Streptomyces sp. NPDC059153]|uniref:helix-turn-helix domain-containing protein n=1 Tax=Streptomyces sp. NPDC059153 TaxID=3346743 RepID=UPI0036B21307
MKTLRYYSDSGLLPVAGRSAGGHRRYGPEAWERIRLIRRLRALDTPIATITQLVTGECSFGELVATELEVVQERLTELRWRQATLKSLDDCPSEERLRRLEILSRVQRLPQAHRTLTDHWYRELSAAMPKRRLDIMIAMLSPDPPQDPDPATVLAYAELHLLVSTPSFTRWTQDHDEEIRDAPAFYGEIDDAAVLTAAALAQGLPPSAGGGCGERFRIRPRTSPAGVGHPRLPRIPTSAGVEVIRLRPPPGTLLGPGRHRHRRARAEYDGGS